MHIESTQPFASKKKTIMHSWPNITCCWYLPVIVRQQHTRTGTKITNFESLKKEETCFFSFMAALFNKKEPEVLNKLWKKFLETNFDLLCCYPIKFTTSVQFSCF